MKINKYTATFIGMFLGISTIFSIAFSKYFFILIHHSITFCQEMTKSLSVGMFKNIGLFIFLALLVIVSITTFKLLVTIAKMVLLKIDLNKNVVGFSNGIFTINSPKPFAFCFGILMPKIYISTSLIKLLTKNELKAVIAHENYHLKSHDTITLMLANIFESLVPYFPLVSDIIRHYKIERELLADQAAILESNNNIISVLRKLLKHELKFNFAGVPAISNADTLHARINKLTNNKNYIKNYKWSNIIVSLVSITFLLLVIIIPVNTVEIHTKGNDTIILCIL